MGLRHQVRILRRGGTRPRYTATDRALLAAVSRLLPPERWSCFALSPQTLRRWHRALLQGDRRPRRRRPGRPPLAAATRSLIERLARENPRWGYMRIQGELLKLGISVSATTVATVLRVSGLGPAPRRIGPNWSTFLRAQAQSMLGVGLPSEPGRGLESNVSATTAPTPDGAACGVAVEGLATNGAEEPSVSRPVRDLARLSPLAAVPSQGDSLAAPPRSPERWHARDGPKSAPTPVARANASAGGSKRVLLAAQRASLQPRVWFPERPRDASPKTAQRAEPAPSRRLNRVSLPHKVRRRPPARQPRRHPTERVQATARPARSDYARRSDRAPAPVSSRMRALRSHVRFGRAC
jgi:hypothetical protein